MTLESNDCLLKREYTLQDRLYWNLMLALPLITAMIGIGRKSVGGLIVYLILVFAGIGLFLRFFCTHCPHYTREQSSISCLFFWRVPKLFPDRQGPLDTKEKMLVGAASFLILGLPVFWLIAMIFRGPISARLWPAALWRPRLWLKSLAWTVSAGLSARVLTSACRPSVE